MKKLIVLGVLAGLLLGAGCEPVQTAPKPIYQPERYTPGGDRSEPIRIVGTKEVDLVESLVQSRYAYQRALEALVKFYEERGNASRLDWARRELKGFKETDKYLYLTDAETASPDLRPTTSIPEADELYRDAKKYAEGLWPSQRDLQIAIEKLNKIIREYPESDKIDDAAFLAAEIFRTKQKDFVRAVRYYERVWQWNPQTNLPARYWAGYIYERFLGDKKQAAQLYADAVKFSDTCPDHADQAGERLRELGRKP